MEDKISNLQVSHNPSVDETRLIRECFQIAPIEEFRHFFLPFSEDTQFISSKAWHNFLDNDTVKVPFEAALLTEATVGLEGHSLVEC